MQHQACITLFKRNQVLRHETIHNIPLQAETAVHHEWLMALKNDAGLSKNVSFPDTCCPDSSILSSAPFISPTWCGWEETRQHEGM